MNVEGLEVGRVERGLRLRLRVRPGARRDGFVGIHGGALKLAVAVPPERGKANERVATLLAESLGIPRGGVTIVAGAASPDKVVVVAGLSEGELLRRLSDVD